MTSLTRARFVTLLGALSLTACDWDGLRESPQPNRPPTVRITGGAVDSTVASYDVEFFWFGSDPDGSVDHFEYAIDDTCLCSYEETIAIPDGNGGTVQTIVTVKSNSMAACLANGAELNYTHPDSVWKRIETYSGRFAFDATAPVVGSDPAVARDWHDFYIKAVDDKGAESRADHRYFNAETIAPTTRLLAPLGEGEEKARTVSSFVQIRWTGRDEDSTRPDKKPVGYQLKMVDIGEIFIQDQIVYNYLTSPFVGRQNLFIPDSLIVPDTTALSETTFHKLDWWPKIATPYLPSELRLEGLPAGRFAVAIIGVDEAGARTPLTAEGGLLISTETNGGNIIKLDVNPGLPVNPVITIIERNLLGSRRFDYRGQDPWEVEVPVNVDLDIEWDVTAEAYGSEIGGVNWTIDIPDPGCEVCQSANGFGGWIGWGNHSGIPFPVRWSEEQANTTHILYVRARDESFLAERENLAVVVMDVVAFPFDRTAMLVDDFKLSGIDDCAHDNIIRQAVSGAVAPYLAPGDELELYNAYLSSLQNPCAESALQSFQNTISLSRMSRFKLLFWNTAGAPSMLGRVTNPSQSATYGKYLSIYAGAGGNVIIWGANPTGALLGDLNPNEAYRPAIPLFGAPNYDEGSFPWDILNFRTEIDRVRGTQTQLQLLCSGIVGMQPTQRALDLGFPAGEVDPTGYSNRSAFWVNTWAGEDNLLAWKGGSAFTGIPPQITAGMDTLYNFVSNGWAWQNGSGVQQACGTTFGSPLENEPVVVRYDDPIGTQGKVVWIGTPLYHFANNHQADINAFMAKMTDWIFEE